MPSALECKNTIRKLADDFKISATDIATKLLCDDDKRLMMSGEITAHTLQCAIIAWIDSGMPNMNEIKE